MQCGEDGVGRRKSGPIAYRATPGRLGLKSYGVGGSGVGYDGHIGWAEVHGRVEKTRSRRD